MQDFAWFWAEVVLHVPLEVAVARSWVEIVKEGNASDFLHPAVFAVHEELNVTVYLAVKCTFYFADIIPHRSYPKAKASIAIYPLPSLKIVRS